MNKQIKPTKSLHHRIILLPSFAGGIVGGKVGGWVGGGSVKEREKGYQSAISSVAKTGRSWSSNSSGASTIGTVLFFENQWI